VLLPGELVPLHIFEERYKIMIGECLEQERDFGIIWLSDDGLKDIGCAARITRVLERFEDGRLNILVDLAYPAGDIVRLDDEPGGDDEALERARTAYADLVEQVTDTRPEPEELAGLDAYGMAATVEIAPAAKQALLELRSEPARLEQLEALFAEALQRIRMAERAAKRASGNGHLNPREQ
jgi:Lon protease-like protein